MKKLISLCTAAIILCSTLGTTSFAEGKTLPFKDVKEKSWYYSAVSEVYTEGIMEGKSADTFAPSDNVTRAELVTILARIKNVNIEGFSAKCDFYDVKDTSWYADYVGWAAERGLVEGYGDGSFRPDAPIKREEMAQLLVKYIKSISMYRLMPPDDPAIDVFTDAGTVSAWATENVEAMRLTGFIRGDENGNFNPRANTTRAEAATLIPKLIYVARTNERASRFNMSRDFLYSDEDYGVLLPYRIYFPEDYDSSKEYPLLVFLHGNSAQGNDNVRHLGAATNLFSSPYSPAYDSIVVVPQCPEGFWWRGYTIDLLARLFDYINSMYSTDMSRQYLAGISMGGDGTWAMLRMYPEKLTAALPVAGTAYVYDENGQLYPVGFNEEMLKVPIFVAYDTDDGFSDGEYNREVIRILRENGAVEVTYKETSGLGHGICGYYATRDDISSLTWMYSKVREVER